MSRPVLRESNLVFQPKLSLVRISCEKLRRFLSWLVIALLILCGLYGIFSLYSSFDEVNYREVDIEWFRELFYISVLFDMFLFFLIQRKKERVRRLGLPEIGQQTEVTLFLSDTAYSTLENTWLFCYRKKYHFLRPIHLFITLIKRKDFRKILKRFNCEPKEIIEKTKKIVNKSSSLVSASRPEQKRSLFGPKLATEVKRIFVDAYILSLKEDKKQIGPLEILRVMTQRENLVGMVFDEFGISSEDVDRLIQWAMIEERIKAREKSFFWRRIFKPKGKLNRAMTATLTPFLDRVSQDLTYSARRGDFEMILGREKEIEEIFNFFDAGRTGIILIGESKIGKKSVLQKLAQLMVEERVPSFLQDKRLVQMDIGSLVGLEGASEKGEEYLRRALFEVARAGNIILAVEHVDSLVGLKSQASGLDFSEILASSLNEQAFFFIGTTSPGGFASKIEGSLLIHSLNQIKVVLPSRDLLWQILITKVFTIERKLKVLFSINAIEQAIDLADRFIYGKALPAKTIDILSETAHTVRKRMGSHALVSEEDITELVARKTKIPLGRVQETEREQLLHLEERIHKRLINQEEAVGAVASALRRSRIELRDRKKTICNFLFVGPTGVGKTELAKTLARVYFGSEKRMIRLDMSEYQEKRSLRRMIGFRSEEGVERGYLTEAVKRQPHSILLLDEIEKAHPDILNVFLQLMDDGRLTDASGETINFTNIIVIATSNAGTQFVQEKIREGIPYNDICGQLKKEVLLEHFRPEFLNRFDKIVLFKSLSLENMINIAKIFLNMITDKLKEKGVIFRIEEAAVQELAKAGYDPLYGARPLKRVIQDRIEDALAKLFLESKVERRDTLILRKGLIIEVQKGVKL